MMECFSNTIFLLQMSHSPEVRFSFKNLEPINYLKTFNRMVDYQTRTSDSSPAKQLRVVSLSKFPTPASYEHMEGIFENVSKKKVEQDMNKYNKELEEEEKFMKKHNDFMRKVLEKFIKHNQERQNTYEKQKIFYSKDFKARHLRAVSEPRLDKIKEEKEKQKEKTVEPSGTDNKATIGSEVAFEEPQQERSCEVLPKLQPRQKKQKVVLKKEKEIENYLVNRKLANSHPNPPQPNPNPEALHSSRMHLPSEEEEPVDFKQEIVGLQRKQVRIQSDFSNRIEKEIMEFGRKMSTQVHAINYFNFWKESNQDQGEEERERRAKKMRQQAQQRQQRVDFQINFRNYQST